MENFKQALKRTTAVLMIVALLVGIAPFGSLADVDWSEFALRARAWDDRVDIPSNVETLLYDELIIVEASKSSPKWFKFRACEDWLHITSNRIENVGLNVLDDEGYYVGAEGFGGEEEIDGEEAFSASYGVVKGAFYYVRIVEDIKFYISPSRWLPSWEKESELDSDIATLINSNVEKIFEGETNSLWNIYSITSEGSFDYPYDYLGFMNRVASPVNIYFELLDVDSDVEILYTRSYKYDPNDIEECEKIGASTEQKTMKNELLPGEKEYRFDNVYYIMPTEDEFTLKQEILLYIPVGYYYDDSHIIDESCSHEYFIEITTQPTCEISGIKSYTCSSCGVVYTEIVESLGHIDTNFDNNCDVCGEKCCDVIILNEAKTVEIEEGEISYLLFTPSESGTYTFVSLAESDTYGYLFDSKKNELKCDDDGLDDDYGNFSIVYNLVAGETYYWGVRFYDWCKGKFEVKLTPGGVLDDADDEEYDDYFYSNGYYYDFEDDKAILIRYVGEGGDVIIPSELHGHPVEKILYSDIFVDYNDDDSDDITSITIPASINEINSYAFDNCSSIQKFFVAEENQDFSSDDSGVLFNKDKTKIIKYPRSKITDKYIIPEGVISVGDNAFMSVWALTSIEIPESVVTIGENAFWGCENLIDIKIGSNITSIGGGAFDYSGYYYNSGNRIDRVLYLDNYLLTSAPNQEDVSGEYSIEPGTKVIADYAFNFCEDLKKLIIPYGVTYIGKAAFNSCYGLESVEIPLSVIEIGDYAFDWCDNLTDIYFAGNEDDWNSIYDEYLDGVTIHYNCASHMHEYKENVTKPSTCVEYGVMTYTCSCGDSYTLPIPMTPDHTFGSWKTTQPATCTSFGFKTRKCSLCGFYETNIIDTIGHNEVTTKAVSATCTKTGLTAGKKCSVCNTTTVPQKTVAKIAHKEVTIPAVTATYTSEGLTAGKKCSVCGTVTMAQKTVAKLTLGKVEDLKAKKIKVAKSSEITLSWTSLGEGVKYEVYQKNGKKWKKLKTTSSTSYTVKKLKAGKEYQFRVRAVVDGVKGSYSKTLKVETIPATATLKLKAGKKQLTASWSKVSDISGYEVQYSTSKKMKSAKTVNVKKSSKKTTINKLTKGKKYYVRIRTYKTVDGKKIYSDWSKVKNVKVK